MEDQQGSDDKKKFIFYDENAPQVIKAEIIDTDEEKISESRKTNRNRQVSLIWNQGLFKMENVSHNIYGYKEFEAQFLL